MKRIVEYLVIPIIAMTATMAFAHPDPAGHAAGTGFLAGLWHPWLVNWQHPLVMVAAGYWCGRSLHGNACSWCGAGALPAYVALHVLSATGAGAAYTCGMLVASMPLFIVALPAGRWDFINKGMMRTAVESF